MRLKTVNRNFPKIEYKQKAGNFEKIFNLREFFKNVK